MDTCTETETETSLIVRGKNVRAFNFRRSQPQTKILSRRIIPKLRYIEWCECLSVLQIHECAREITQTCLTVLAIYVYRAQYPFFSHKQNSFRMDSLLFQRTDPGPVKHSYTL